MDFMKDVAESVNSQDPTTLPYMVNPDVKDIIKLGDETTPDNAAKINRIGMDILGPKGSQITRLFVSQSQTRTAYNQYKGTVDMISFVSDVNDDRDDIHRQVNGARLDKAAVTFLIDNSTSMISTIGHMYAILSGLLTYLGRATIPTEAIGYTVESSGSMVWRDGPSHLTIIKEFREQFAGAAMRRCVPPSFMCYTNDIDGMMFAVPRLWARPEKKKILMVLCDGEPFFGSAVITEKAKKSYKEYIKRCREAGIIVFGIGIDKDLSEYFGQDFASVDLSNAGEVLIDKLTSILNRVRA